MTQVSLVSIDWLALSPVVAPVAGAMACLVLDAIFPRLVRPYGMVGVLALLAGLAFAVPAALRPTGQPRRTLCLPSPDGTCLYEADRLVSAFQGAALASALVILLLMWPRDEASDTQRGGPAVLVSLVLAATAGAAGVAAAHDLGSWLVCLELATLPVIALVALRGTAAAGRGALALLTTSLVSFAMVALGAALWLTATGQAVFAADAAHRALADPHRRVVLLLGVLFLIAGLAFKLSLAPFHVWTPQAYVGASDPVAAFLAATSKVAALAALLVVVRPIAVAGGPVLVAVGVLAAVSMTVGNLLALVQDDPIRLLAWSTVAQAGWVVLPLSVVQPASAAASGGYLLAYLVATLVAFTVVHLVGHSPAAAQPSGAPTAPVPHERRTLAAYTGLLRSHPLLGGALGLALLSLAGLPPGVVGLVAKVVALRPVVGGGQWVLALVAVANAVLGVAVYLRWFAVLLRDPEEGAPGPWLGRLPRAGLAALVLTGVALIATSVMPQLLLGLLG
ncbi:MAG TPA: proton-conducting transporter membrane subunit [Pedococcus sp.]|nr:proton-conducting transporter membrane subunit [Pedococcus sp.]